MSTRIFIPSNNSNILNNNNINNNHNNNNIKSSFHNENQNILTKKKGLNEQNPPKKRSALGSLSNSEVNVRLQNKLHQSNNSNEVKKKSINSTNTKNSIIVINNDFNEKSDEYPIDEMICSHITKQVDSADYIDSLAKKSKKQRLVSGLTVGLQNQKREVYNERDNFNIPEIDISFQSEEHSFNLEPPISDEDLLSLLE